MQIEAYVVVGDDDHYCDAQGHMPPALRHPTEWAFFQAGLDAVDIVVLGRIGHEVTPNPSARRRLVLTRSVPTCEQRGEHVYWNPLGASLPDALALFTHPAQALAVVGGQLVCDHFLGGPHTYDRFYLSRIAGVRLPGGRGVFSDVSPNTSAADIFRRSGYENSETSTLASGVSVETWTPTH